MGVKERIIEFINSKEMPIKQFEEKCNLSNGYISSMRKGFGTGKLENVLNAFPELNRNWLLYGEGNMLISQLKKQDFYGGDDFEFINYVPLLPISAQGGSLNDFVVSVKDSDCEQVISPIKGADFAMTVAGDSMSPEYPSGSQILIKKINERAFIDWGKVYVLDTCNGSVIKKIFPSEDKNPEKLRSVSINPDYPPFEVALENVFGIYRVLLCMSVK